MKVLIADDEIVSLKMLRKLIDWEGLGLQYCGYAQDGPSLYQQILQKKPDLVITDIMMPGYDGLKLIARTLEAGLSIHFLITSAYANFSYARIAMRLGVKDFLEKPIDADELNHALRQIIDEQKKCTDNPPDFSKDSAHTAISKIIQTAKEYIDQHYAEKITLETVSDYIYLSPNYLSSLFHKEMKLSFVEYITDVRMRKAQKFLLDRKLTVSDVARMTGYRDCAYFSSVFIKKYGVSPSEWKKNAGAEL